MTIKTCVCSFVKCSLRVKTRTILLLIILLAHVPLGSSTFAQSCKTEEERAVSLSEGDKVWLRTTAESVQLPGSSTGCDLEKDSLYRVTGKNSSLVISEMKTSSKRVCELDGVLLQVPNRSVFVSCRKKKEKAEEELEEIISAPSHGIVSHVEKEVRRSEKSDDDPPEEPQPSITDLPTEVPVIADPTEEDGEQPLTSMAPEELPTTTSGTTETPAPRGPRPSNVTVEPKLVNTTVFPNNVSNIQTTPSEIILTTALNIIPTTSLPIVPTPSPTLPSRVATTPKTTLPTTSPTLRPTTTVPIVTTALPPSLPDASEPSETISTEIAETMSDGGQGTTKPLLLETTPKLQESRKDMSIIMANLPYIIGGAAGILLLLVFITVLVVLSRRRKKKASGTGNLNAGRADYVRHQDAMDSQDMANVNILMYAADEPQHHVEMEDIIDRHKDESSVPVMPKCLQDDNFE